MKWGRTDRPADQPQDGPVRDAARPGSYVGNVLGCCARGSGQPACNGRPARGEAATSSTGTMPQTRGTGQCAGRTPTRVSEGPKRETLQPLRMCPPGRPSGERGSILPVRPLGGCSESKARSYAAGPGFWGRESSRFLGRKHWKKPETASIIARTTERMEGPKPCFGPLRPNCSLRLSAHFAPM